MKLSPFYKKEYTCYTRQLMFASLRCAACGHRDAAFECARCEREVYCSAACQKSRWQRGHKTTCRLQARASVGEPICMSKFVLNRELGRGAFGVVYDVYDRDSRKRVALKVAHPIGAASIAHEIEVVQKLTAMKVQNIVEFRGTGKCDLLENRVFYAMRIEDGTLQSFIDNGNKLDGPAFFSLLFELVFTLRQFRENGFQHRDIKTENVLYRNVPDARAYTIAPGRVFIARGTTQPIYADFNTGTFAPDPESSDTVSLIHAVLAELIDDSVNVTEDEEAKMQEVFDLIVDDDGTVEALDRVLERIAY